MSVNKSREIFSLKINFPNKSPNVIGKMLSSGKNPVWVMGQWSFVDKYLETSLLHIWEKDFH